MKMRQAALALVVTGGSLLAGTHAFTAASNNTIDYVFFTAGLPEPAEMIEDVDDIYIVATFTVTRITGEYAYVTCVDGSELALPDPSKYEVGQELIIETINDDVLSIQYK